MNRIGIKMDSMKIKLDFELISLRAGILLIAATQLMPTVNQCARQPIDA